MIPAGLVRIDRMPFTVTGKLDYKELSERKILFSDEADEVPAVTDKAALEAVISAAEKVFGADREIVPESDLFSMGLDSLTAFRMISRLKEAGYDAEINDLFSYPTPQRLAAVIGKRSGEDGGKELTERGTYAATGVQMYWGLDIDEFKKTHGLYISDMLLADVVCSEESFRERTEAIVKRHSALRSYITVENGMPVQKFSETCRYSADFYDLTEFSEDALSVSEKQEAFIREKLMSRMEEITAAEEITALYLMCAQISEKAVLL